jgi:LDH2 family malate/lactate/ureidoglycolate dehydrogenase
LINAVPKVRIAHQSPSAATMDGDNGLGPVVATAAMELAIQKAKKQGAAAVTVRRSNDFGVAGYYARMALPEQMVGIAMSNGAPMVVPPGGSRAGLGTNPLAIAIPAAESNPPFVMDISTSVVSKGRIEEAKKNGESIPEGWALDTSGEPTTDPEAALRALRLLPLGSRPETGSHKGFGLALAIDILCGVLSGGAFGQELSGAEGGNPEVARLGHFFIALRIRSFGPWVNFRNRIDVMLRKLSPRGSGEHHILYPGEPEFEMERLRRAQGIPLPPDVADRLQRIARGFGLEDAWEHLLESRK